MEKIIHQNEVYALIVRADFSQPGITFFTPNEYSQQLAYMHHPQGKKIAPHIHNPVPREVTYTQEVLVIQQGKLRVDFYDENQVYLTSRVMNKGDVILLAKGGHGFEIMEEVKMFEIKQGPFVGEKDKTRFDAQLPMECLHDE